MVWLPDEMVCKINFITSDRGENPVGALMKIFFWQILILIQIDIGCCR